MATLVPFPVTKAIPVWGLAKHECEALHAEAYDLMLQGSVTGTGTQKDGLYMCVFDGDGQPYFIGREEGNCYLFHPNGTLLGQSQRFEDVLRVLVIMLSPIPDMPV